MKLFSTTNIVNSILEIVSRLMKRYGFFMTVIIWLCIRPILMTDSIMILHPSISPELWKNSLYSEYAILIVCIQINVLLISFCPTTNTSSFCLCCLCDSISLMSLSYCSESILWIHLFIISINFFILNNIHYTN